MYSISSRCSRASQSAVSPDLVAEGLGEPPVVEEPRARAPKVLSHPLGVTRSGVTDVRRRADDHHPVEAREHARSGVGVDERALSRYSRSTAPEPRFVPATPD